VMEGPAIKVVGRIDGGKQRVASYE